MSEDRRKKLDNVIRIDEGQIRGHLDHLVRSTVGETLNGLLDAEADRLCGAERYQRSEGRRDYRSGYDERGLETKAGRVNLKMPKLRQQTFETAIIERYRRPGGVGGGIADRDVPGGGVGAAGGGHHPGAVGHAGFGEHGQ